jgi:hypothetical protein
MDIVPVVVSQFWASLEMLKQVIQKCPADLWLAGDPPVIVPEEGPGQPARPPATPVYFWQVAYHSLFYVHLYLQPTEADFVSWERHRANVHFLALSPEEKAEMAEVVEPYTRAELLEYATFLQEYLDGAVRRLDFEAPSGFYWLPFNKLELQFYSLRHLQGHVGELSERLMVNGGGEIGWVGRKR